MGTEYQEQAKVFKALCEPKRLAILEQLRGGEKCACKLLETLQITQPTLSHHMKIMCDSGLVLSERDGKWVYYSLNCEKLNRLIAFLGCTKCNMHE